MQRKDTGFALVVAVVVYLALLGVLVGSAFVAASMHGTDSAPVVIHDGR